ncbi:MAG: BadF/BadG/BcrA/BcrD ATPase family protein [Pseudomonadota bacterium]
MIESQDIPVIAIDGGGTRCRIAYFDGKATTVAESGCANVSTGFDAAINEIERGLELLAERTGVSRASLCALPAFVGLAGVMGGEIADRVVARLPFEKLRVEDDRRAALRGALGGRDGIVAHCGTGSFFALQVAGTMHLAGGWGPVVGDEASAQWIGRHALGIVLKAIDGRLESSAMSERIGAEYDGPADIVRFAGAASPSEFGRLAPLVTELARNGDPLACRVMQRGADEIAASLRNLGWTRGLAICLTGGIGPHFAPFLPEYMAANVAAPAGGPLTGAISLAQDFAREGRR